MIDADSKAYLDAAKSWETDAVTRSRRSERIAWRVAIGGGVLAIAGVAAVAGLAPFKEVEPFIVRVDKNTGFTDIVTRVDEQSMTPNEAIDKFFLNAYVNAREEYSDGIAFANYQKIGLMSGPQEGQEYYSVFRPESPTSPINTHGTHGSIEVKVNSISFLDEGVASVRFEKLDKNKGQESRSRWIATITYEYLDPPISESERLINPLGFQVSDYRVDAETVSTAAASGGGL